MTILTSKDVKVQFGPGFPTVIIGERISPTNKNGLANEVTGLPICIDSSNPKAIEKALKIYQYKALINSTTGEDSKLEV